MSDTDTADDLDTFDDEQVRVLSADNRDEVLAPQAKLFKFPQDEGRPVEGFMVRHASFGRITRYQRASTGGSQKQQLQALCDLIADSVVGVDGQPVWDASQVQAISQARTDRFMVIQNAVATHNGLKPDTEQVQDMVDAAAKN